MPTDQNRPIADGRTRALRRVERLLVAAGSVMLLWCAFVLVDAGLAQRSARRSLEASSRRVDAILPGSEVDDRGTASAAAAITRGAAVGVLSIPRVDLAAVILEGTDATTLRRGAGHVENTALPGNSGNVVVAGHRDTFFRPLQWVHVGDDIVVETPNRRVRYRVTSMDVVKPHDLSVLASGDESVLTLITCYPFWVLGAAPDRFVVRASRVVDEIDEETPAALVAQAAMIQVPDPPVRLRPDAAPPPRDDRSVIGDALERFRSTYNARLASHGDMRPGGPLTFAACDVAVDGDRAAAYCEETAPASGGPSRHWTAALQRVDDVWGITSIVAD